jgi:hypothetical protein
MTMTTSFDWTTYTGDDPAPVLAALDMAPVDDDAKYGQHLVLLIDYGPDNERDGMGGSLEDSARYGVMIGHNPMHNTGDDVWYRAGWCWSQDHYYGETPDDEQDGTVVGYRPLLPSGFQQPTKGE